MEMDFCGPSIPPRFTQSVQSNHGFKHLDFQSEHSDPQSEHSEQPQRVCSSKVKKHSDKKKHKVRAKYFTSQSSSSEEDQSSIPVKKSAKPQKAPSEQDQQQDNPDPVFYREVHMSDVPSQYAKKVPFLKMPLRNLSRTSWPLIYLRVNIFNPLLQQQTITRWDSLVLRTSYRNLIQILPRSVFLLNPLGLLWARFPYKFLRNLNIKLGRISLPSTSQLPLQRLFPLVILLWRSVSTVLRLPLKGLKARFRTVPILKN